MDIYIKMVKKASIYGKKQVPLKDIARILAPASVQSKVENTPVLSIQLAQEKKYTITNLDVIRILNHRFPDANVQSIGETDTLICYSPNEKKVNKPWLYFKVAVVTLILLAGSSTAIMSFHTDSQIPAVFKTYYYVFFREISQNPLLIDIPYSIGIALGIIIFFNHFSRKKITDDPTPIQVEMEVYEQEVTDTLVNMLDREENKNQ